MPLFSRLRKNHKNIPIFKKEDIKKAMGWNVPYDLPFSIIEENQDFGELSEGTDFIPMNPLMEEYTPLQDETELDFNKLYLENGQTRIEIEVERFEINIEMSNVITRLRVQGYFMSEEMYRQFREIQHETLQFRLRELNGLCHIERMQWQPIEHQFEISRVDLDILITEGGVEDRVPEPEPTPETQPPPVFIGSRQNPNYYWAHVNGSVRVGDPIDAEGNIVPLEYGTVLASDDERVIGIAQETNLNGGYTQIQRLRGRHNELQSHIQAIGNDEIYRDTYNFNINAEERENIWNAIQSQIDHIDNNVYHQESLEEPKVVISLLCSEEFNNELIKRFKKETYLRFFMPNRGIGEHKILGTYKILAFERKFTWVKLYGKKVDIPDNQNQIEQLFNLDQHPQLFPENFEYPNLNIQTETHQIHSVGVHNKEEFKIKQYNHNEDYSDYLRAYLSLKGRKIHPNEFKVNDYISLRLEGEKINIYVNGEKFDQCKFLLLNLEPNKEYKEINSIDDAAKQLSKRMEIDHSIISPETEFWGHCSNLQAWVENDYDLRIIHTNLGIPLLKKLIECGDPKAKIAWKEEIMFRIEETKFKAYQIYKYDINKYFTDDEKTSIYEIVFPKKEEFIKGILKMDFKEYIELLEKSGSERFISSDIEEDFYEDDLWDDEYNEDI